MGLGLGISSSQIFTLRIVVVILLLVTVVAVIVGVVDREENAKRPQPLNPTARSLTAAPETLMHEE